MSFGLGSISHGTLRQQDLIPRFTEALNDQSQSIDFSSLIEDANDWQNASSILIQRHPDWINDAEEALTAVGEDLLESLLNALNECAPPYCYFGTAEGDGADFGFWLSPDHQQQWEDDGVLTFSELSEVPSTLAHFSYFLLVNDHGNPSLYMVHPTPDGAAVKFDEIWSIV